MNYNLKLGFYNSKKILMFKTIFKIKITLLMMINKYY